MKTIVGYTDRLSVMPGETLHFMVSCEADVATYRADIVRFGSTDDNPWGRGFLEHPVDAEVNREYPARRQETEIGSYMDAGCNPTFDALESFSIQAMIWPTLIEAREQAMLSRWSECEQRGFALYVNRSGELALKLGDGSAIHDLPSGKVLRERAWYAVTASFDAVTGKASLSQTPVVAESGVDDAADLTSDARLVPDHTGLRVLVGAWGTHSGSEAASAHFNGRIDSPRLACRVLNASERSALWYLPLRHDLHGSVVAAWDFGRDQQSKRVQDASANRLDGILHNLPARGVTGWRWDGTEQDYRRSPDHYSAIHFHDDDVSDAGWSCDFAWQLPDDLPSGVYAARLHDGNDDEHVVFFVRPVAGKTRSRIAFLASTATYLAYANDRLFDEFTGYEVELGTAWTFGPEDLYLAEHRELGSSTYHAHRDASPIFYSSARRPMLNIRPRSVLWTFNGDMMVLDWLEACGYEFDVITDEDLHREGVSLLTPYRVVLTGGHPEYASRQMLDALDSFTGSGGRLMYLGGNGFVHCVAFHPEQPGLLERRWVHGAPRSASLPGPGEAYYHFTGEFGGRWRRLGRPESRLTGLDFCTSGFDTGAPYRRSAESFEPSVSWVFDGVAEEVFGDFGLAGGGGAAGQEVDWHLGGPDYPSGVTVLASSENHTWIMQQDASNENLGTRNAREHHADMVIFERPNCGAVFSVGSISWPQSLSFNFYDNDVSRITRNVLDRFHK